MAISLRKFPYPFLAMTCIDSDTDNTQSSKYDIYKKAAKYHNFEEIHRYLNTKEATHYGTGLGLDISDSFFSYNHFKHVADLNSEKYSERIAQMTMFDGISTTKKKNAANIIKYIKCGWIDAFHSIGDFSTDSDNYLCTREMSLNTIDHLNRNGAKIKCWINHGSGKNYQNIHQSNAQLSGYENIDAVIAHGVKFFWFGNGSVYPAPTEGIDTNIFQQTLFTGDKVWGYLKYTADYTNAQNLHLQVTKQRLDSMVSGGKYLIFSNHIGNLPFDTNTLNTFNLLKSYQDDNKILIARSIRILNYDLAYRYLAWSHDTVNDKIIITSINDPQKGSYIPTLDDIRGITFSDTTINTKIYINQSEIDSAYISKHLNNTITMIKWFDADYTDYTLIKNYSPINFR